MPTQEILETTFIYFFFPSGMNFIAVGLILGFLADPPRGISEHNQVNPFIFIYSLILANNIGSIHPQCVIKVILLSTPPPFKQKNFYFYF